MKRATCHPKSRHIARGLCSQCYWKQYRALPAAVKLERRRAREDAATVNRWRRSDEAQERLRK